MVQKLLSQKDSWNLFIQGKQRWNRYFEQHPNSIPDFSGASFSGINGANFEGYIFPSGVNFEGATFAHANFEDCFFGGPNGGANSNNHNNSSVNFRGCLFSGDITSFENSCFFAMKVDFSNTKFTTNSNQFRSVRFFSEIVDFSNSLFAGISNFDFVEIGTLDISPKVSFVRVEFDFFSIHGAHSLMDYIIFESALFRKQALFTALNWEGNKCLFKDVQFGQTDSEIVQVSFETSTFDCEEFKIENCEINGKNSLSFESVSFSGKSISLRRLKAVVPDVLFSNISISAQYFSIEGCHFLSDIINLTEWEIDAEFLLINTIFEGSIFSAQRSKFYDNLDFNSVYFKVPYIDFSNSAIIGKVSQFSIVQDGGVTSFERSVLGTDFILSGSQFKGSVDFTNAVFDAPPDLQNCFFGTIPVVKNKQIELTQDGFALVNIADRYSRLKYFASQLHERPEEITFLERELFYRAEEDGRWRDKAFHWLYKNLSDFGRSVSSPVIWAVCVCWLYGAFFTLYGLICGQKDWSVPETAFRLSLAAILPTFGYNRSEVIELKQQIFGEHHSLIFDVLVYSETALGLLFLFLIGLALRNRFRI